MARIHISNDPSGQIVVSFPYDLLLVEKIKTIDGRRWHPSEKYWMEHFFESAPWSFPTTPYPPHRWGRERVGVKKSESHACVVGKRLSRTYGRIIITSPL